ncbi:MAG: ATP-dependent Clp protease ATP-binding subunit, partial [Prevotella sp.]|nr:ATP-dependent Clp protease ATP-binding subunit [Prevotella sp.]
MTSQFSPKVSEILAFSREEAQRLSSLSVGPEHLLLGLLRSGDGPVWNVFTRLQLNTTEIKQQLEQIVREPTNFYTPLNSQELVLNENASNILKLAVLEARMQHMQKVNEEHLLLAILHDQGNNKAKDVLQNCRMSYEDVLSLL